jgi:hypothetical protein
MSMGKGLNAILKGPDKLKPAETSEVTTDEVTTEVVPTEAVATNDETAEVTTGAVTISQDAITKAVSDAKKSPRISTWSPVAVGTLKSLWMTKPQFSMSDEIRTLVEEGLAKKYPELVELVKKELGKSG